MMRRAFLKRCQWFFMKANLEEIGHDYFNKPLKEVELKSIVQVLPNTPVPQAIKMMKDGGIGAIFISENDRLLGVLSEADLLYKMQPGKDWTEKLVQEVMTVNPLSVDIEQHNLSHCMQLCSRYRIHHLPVLKNGSPLYMISILDIMGLIREIFPKSIKEKGVVDELIKFDVEACIEGFDLPAKSKGQVSGRLFLTPLKRLVYNQPIFLDHQVPLSEVMLTLQGKKRGTCLIMEYETRLKGVVTERDLLFKLFEDAPDRFNPGLEVKDFMAPTPHLFFTKNHFAHAINYMVENGHGTIILVDKDNFPVGLVSHLEIFQFITDYIFAKDKA